MFVRLSASGSRVKKLVRMQEGSYVSTTYIDGVYEYVNDDRNKQNHIYIMDADGRLAELRLGNIWNDTTPELKYVLSDHLGSSTVLLQPNGALINKEEYYPFGETSFGSYGLKRYRFCGKERDNESGLYYYGARYYAAWLYRFTSVDPLAAKSTDRNPYHYASNNPINRTDPTGMSDGKGDGKGGGVDKKQDSKTASNSTISQKQIHYISNDGEYLGQENGSKDLSLSEVNNMEFRLISKSDFVGIIEGKNKLETLQGASRLLTFDSDKARNDLNSLLEGGTTAGSKEKHLFIVINKNTGKIETQLQDSSQNTNKKAYNDWVKDKKGFLAAKGNASMMVVGQAHSHPLDAKARRSSFDEFGQPSYRSDETINVMGPSAIDDRALAIKESMPVYAVESFDSKVSGTIHYVDPSGEVSKSISNVSDQGFDILKHSLVNYLINRK